MKHKPLIFLFLCLIITACRYAEASSNISQKKREKGLEHVDQYLSKGEIEKLKNISHKTYDKIQKRQVLQFADVVSMQHSGIESDTIIQILISTSSKFNLTSAQIVLLQNAGVSFKVINYMLRTNSLLVSETVTPENPPQPEPEKIVVTEPKTTLTEKKSPIWSLSMGALLEQVCITGSQYAYTKNGNASTSTAMPANGKTLQPSFDLDWGITAGIAHYFPEKSWSLNSRFDWIAARGKGSKSADGSNNIIPINIWRDQFFAELDADLGVAAYGRSNFKIDYYNLNIDLDRALYIDKNFTFEPHMGLKASFIYDRVTSTFTGNGSDTSLFSETDMGTNVLTREQKTNFWGVGPSMGFGSDWNIKSGLSLFFEGTASILIGKTFATDSVTYSAFESSSTYSASPNLTALSPTIQTLLGLKYSKSFWNDSQKVMVKLGWDSSFYWNQWNHVNTVSESTYSSSMDTFQLQEGNTFGLTGLMANLTWSF